MSLYGALAVRTNAQLCRSAPDGVPVLVPEGAVEASVADFGVMQVRLQLFQLVLAIPWHKIADSLHLMSVHYTVVAPHAARVGLHD